MGGRRTTKEELAQLEALTKEGLTTKEVAERLGRSPAAIRNLRYKKHLVGEMEDEKKTLTRQIGELQCAKRFLQEEIGKLEATLRQDRGYMRHTIAEILITLKKEKPDLFSLWSWSSPPEQMTKLVDAISEMETRFK